MTNETEKLITEKERQAIEKAADVYTNNTWKYAPEENKESFIAGAEKLAELRNAEKPSEEFVRQIISLMPSESRMHDFLYEYTKSTCTSEVIGANKLLSFFKNVASKEIAKLVTQKDAELLEAAKDALTTFYGIGCTDEADIVQALKKAISNY